MEFRTFVFYFLATILVFASLRVVTLRNPVHAALHLVLAFFSASGIWVLLQADNRQQIASFTSAFWPPIDCAHFSATR